MHQLQQFGTPICFAQLSGHLFVQIAVEYIESSLTELNQYPFAKFSLEEVNALQAGGNDRARQTYFRTWDLERNAFPDSSNIHRLRDFIKHVYVDRRYTGEKPVDLLPRLKLRDKDDYGTLNERSSSQRRNADSYIRCSSDVGRSPSYCRDDSRSGNIWKAPADERLQDYDPAILKRSATQMFTTADIKPGRGSPSHPNNRGVSSPPAVLPIRELLGDNGPALRVGDWTKSSNKRVVDASAHLQANDSFKSNTRSVNDSANPQWEFRFVAQICRKSASSDTSANTQTQQMPASKDYGKTATSEPSTVETSPSVPNKNTLEFLLFELSTPAEAFASNHPGAYSSDDIQAAAPQGTPTLPVSEVRYPTLHQHVQALSHTPRATVSTSSSGPTQLSNTGVPEVSRSGMALMMPEKGGAASHAVPHAHMQALSCTQSATMNALSNRPRQPPNAGVPEVSATGMALMMPSNAAASSLAAPRHAVPVGHIPVLPGTHFNMTTDKLTLPVSSAGVTASPVQMAHSFPSNTSGASMFAHSQVMTASLGGILAPTPASLGMPTQPPSRGASPGMVPSFLVDDENFSAENAERQQFPSVLQPQHSASCVSESSSPAQQTLAFHGAANNKPRVLPLAADNHEPCSKSPVQSSQSARGPVLETETVAGAQPNALESKPSGRSELPADLFTAVYPSGPATVPGWQTGPHYGMGFNIQYPPASMRAPAFINAATKPRNPFDFSEETTQGPGNMFASMASLQGALANVSAPAGLSTSAFGAHSLGANMGQRSYGNMPPSRPHGLGGFGSEGGMLASPDSNQQPAYQYLTPPNPSSLRMQGGNPFG
ncbi:hypothetical protein Ancab_002260 [Ancistrocladus abbreviatus]